MNSALIFSLGAFFAVLVMFLWFEIYIVGYKTFIVELYLYIKSTKEERKMYQDYTEHPLYQETYDRFWVKNKNKVQQSDEK